ncbi:MAG: type II toxin-antitoxin system HicA family toxin [Methanosarcinales archaeon]|nr:type II toxin-antitoxin system HicA family toxin [Methanosarcinales archaeon]MCD4810593.1 type II toxin-antitoxin system HicA family toxin [Methanosarcinales archaeon]
MSKLPLVSSDKIIKSLLKAGFDYAPIKGKGSHTALVREGLHGEKFLVIIPKRNPIPKGTLISIIKQSGYSRDELITLLD